MPLLALLLLILPAAVQTSAPAGINAQAAQLNLETARLNDLTRVFGAPEKYVWGERTFTKDNLPALYLAMFPGGVMAVMQDGRLYELRFNQPGYAFRGKLQVGDTIDQALAVLGPPRSTERGAAKVSYQDGVLYLDVGGRPGAGYYGRADLGVRMFFGDGKVAGLYLQPRRVAAAAPGGRLSSLPRFDPDSRDPFQMDLRGRDLAALDLRDRREDLLYCTFDDRTKWPPAERMPAGFDPARIAELGRRPGLGVRRLHQRGITGRGVGIAIIDNPLLAGHQEYAARLRSNDRTGGGPADPQMHGGAVVSIAAGKTAGVAPETGVYCVANNLGGSSGVDFKGRAEAVRLILAKNDQLPAGNKIRVISMPVGWSPEQSGFAEMEAAAKTARVAGMLFVSSSTDRMHGFKFHGLGRAPLADPDDFNSYEPGLWWARGFLDGRRFRDRLLAPMDSRTTAAPDAPNQYVFYRQGGSSWTIPCIAGVYALAAQVDPVITPEKFWSLAIETGRTIERKHGSDTYQLGPILDPVALVDALQRQPKKGS